MARKNIYLPDKMIEEIGTVQADHEIATESQAITRLLQIGLHVVMASQRGEAIIKRDENGHEIELMFFV